jgi:hypothetical protein
MLHQSRCGRKIMKRKKEHCRPEESTYFGTGRKSENAHFEVKGKKPFSRPWAEEIKVRTFTSKVLEFLQVFMTYSQRNHYLCSWC